MSDDQLEERHRRQMHAVARAIDEVFNGKKRTRREVGFVLMVFPFDDHGGRCNFISNGAHRRDLVVLFKQLIARFEGQTDVSGHA